MARNVPRYDVVSDSGNGLDKALWPIQRVHGLKRGNEGVADVTNTGVRPDPAIIVIQIASPIWRDSILYVLCRFRAGCPKGVLVGIIRRARRRGRGSVLAIHTADVKVGIKGRMKGPDRTVHRE